MKPSLLRSSLLVALISHAAGLLSLILLGFFGYKSSDPDKLLIWLGVGGLIIGALICGLLSRLTGSGLYGALISGGIYLLPSIVGWIVCRSDTFSLPTRLGIMAGCQGLILVLATVGQSVSDGHRRRKRRSAIKRSVERRLG